MAQCASLIAPYAPRFYEPTDLPRYIEGRTIKYLIYQLNSLVRKGQKELRHSNKYGLETIWPLVHYLGCEMASMRWQVLFHAEFQPEFEELPVDIQDELLARLRVLSQFGPQLGRPNVDTLQGSAFGNMKELRFQLDGIWRFAFAFDPERNGIVLCGGDKEGDKDFYRNLIATADRRYTAHIASIRRKTTKD